MSAHPSPNWHTALPGRTAALRASREPLRARGLAAETNGQTPPLCMLLGSEAVLEMWPPSSLESEGQLSRNAADLLVYYARSTAMH